MLGFSGARRKRKSVRGYMIIALCVDFIDGLAIFMSALKKDNNVWKLYLREL